MQVRAVFEDSDGNLWLGEEEEKIRKSIPVSKECAKSINRLMDLIRCNATDPAKSKKT